MQQRPSAHGIDRLTFGSGAADDVADLGNGLWAHDGHRAEIIDVASIVVHEIAADQAGGFTSYNLAMRRGTVQA